MEYLCLKIISLRALLIHKGTKLPLPVFPLTGCLRALLIHKGTKLARFSQSPQLGLRALLIHKGTKQSKTY